MDSAAKATGFHPPVVAGGPLSPAAFTSTVCSGFGDKGFFSMCGAGDVDLAGEELSDRPLDADLDLDFDLFKPAETDLDFDLLTVFLGDLDFLLAGADECDFDRCLRDNERDLDRLACLGETFLLEGDRERFLAGDREADRRRGGGVLDLVRLRGLLDRERRVRLRTTTERERVLLPLRTDRERERRDLGGGDLLRRDKDRLLERLPPVRLANDRDLERRPTRLDLEEERRVLVMERERERLLTAPPRLGERVLERLVPPR